MSLFSIDEKKCNRDDICAAVCPMGIIKPGNKKTTPSPVAVAEELCINCGHCVAVCPNAALSHVSMTPAVCPPVRKDWLPGPEKVEHFLRARRSIRTYKTQIVERDVLTRLISISRFAPSGHNTQPVQWLVIYDSEKVRTLSENVIDWMRHMLEKKDPIAQTFHLDQIVTMWEKGFDRICRGAPHVIITHAPKEELSAPAACTIALSYLELAAPSLGLGACWAGYFNAAVNLWPPMQKTLNLPVHHTSFGAMMVGYPEHEYHRLPLRNKPLITWA